MLVLDKSSKFIDQTLINLTRLFATHAILRLPFRCSRIFEIFDVSIYEAFFEISICQKFIFFFFLNVWTSVRISLYFDCDQLKIVVVDVFVDLNCSFLFIFRYIYLCFFDQVAHILQNSFYSKVITRRYYNIFYLREGGGRRGVIAISLWSHFFSPKHPNRCCRSILVNCWALWTHIIKGFRVCVSHRMALYWYRDQMMVVSMCFIWRSEFTFLLFFTLRFTKGRGN